MATATPEQMIEAWEVGVMHGYPGQVRREFGAHPPPVNDPIYYRGDDLRTADEQAANGWSRASTIKNPSAIHSMRYYLTHKLEVAAPHDVEAAWQRTLRRKACEDRVEAIISRALTHAWAIEAETEVEFAQTVITALTRDIS